MILAADCREGDVLMDGQFGLEWLEEQRAPGDDNGDG